MSECWCVDVGVWGLMCGCWRVGVLACWRVGVGVGVLVLACVCLYASSGVWVFGV